MKSFLRENPTIAFGLGLPLLLVVVFLLISGLPTLFVESPKYDVLYTTGNQHYKRDVQISVVNKKVQVSHHSDINNNTYANNMLRLWRYNSRTGAVKEIAIVLPPSTALPSDKPTSANQSENERVSKTTSVDMPELAGLTIDSSSIAPDGYEFNVTSGRYSGNVFGGLFYSRRYSTDAQLSKGGRNVRLPNTVDRYYGRSVKLIGWVVAE